ncbi:hypothetical protein IX51_09415 [uncultured archaeon]|nr:hypothetical protein IX51_09415 [uncultured archaeon]
MTGKFIEPNDVPSKDLQTIGIINASERFAGITNIMLQYKNAFQNIGLCSKWFQLMDKKDPGQYPVGEVKIQGNTFFGETLSMGINRLFCFKQKMKSAECDLAFISDPTLIRTFGPNVKAVTFVHDLRPLTEYADRKVTTLIYRHLLKNLKESSLLIVPSMKTKVELLEFGFEKDRIEVVIESTLFKKTPSHISESADRITSSGKITVAYVAQDKPHKNIVFFLELAKIAHLQGNKIEFILVSKLKRSTKEQLNSFTLPNLCVVENAENMEEVYSNTDVLIYPSRYEGFGIPLVEAMAFGIPIIANDIEPMKEIVGDAGQLVPLDSPVQWIECITQLLDVNLYRESAEKSIRQFDNYSQMKFLRRVRQVFQKIISEV